MTMSPEAKKAFLDQSMFGSVDTQSPLRHFKGDLTDIEPEEITTNFGLKTRVKLKFDNVDVHESTTPYVFKTAELVFMVSPSSISAWGILGNSVVGIYSKQVSFGEVLGKRIEIKWTPDHPTRKEFPVGSGTWVDQVEQPAGSGIMVPLVMDAYEVISIEGVGGAVSIPSATVAEVMPASVTAALSMDDVLASCADGKNMAGFNYAALNHAKVLEDTAVQGQIIDNCGGVLQGLIAGGKITLDDAGLYHKVA